MKAPVVPELSRGRIVFKTAQKRVLQGMVVMRRAEAREGEQRQNDRFASTLVIATSIIAAVRLAREHNIDLSSPRVLSLIAESMG
jgi:hypothetical protein